MEKVRLLGLKALKEIITAYLSNDVLRHFDHPTGQKSADVYDAMWREIEKGRSYIRKDENYLARRKQYKKQLAAGEEVKVVLRDGSKEELLRTVMAVHDSICTSNKKLKAMSVGDEGGARPSLTLFTRDWSQAYYQMANSQPNKCHFYYSQPSGPAYMKNGKMVHDVKYQYAKSSVLNVGAVGSVMGFLRVS